MKLLLATSNLGKARDMRALLADADIEILTLHDFADLPEVEEDGATFRENAHKKASEISALTGLPTLADDSGLVVDALGGEPGVYSARYAGEPKSDRANNEKLLENLKDIPEPEKRRARFVCNIAFIPEAGSLHESDGKCEGYIGSAPRGENGFGYDPIFESLDFPGKTMAQLTQDEKNSISHRGNAMREISSVLREWIKESA